MKKFTVLLIGTLFSITCMIAFSHHEKKNRYSDNMVLVISYTYDRAYLTSSVIFESVGRTGTDGEWPLYSRADTWSELSDGGYEWVDSTRTNKNDPPPFLPENRRWIVKSNNSGVWQYKDYDERITVSSYASVSCYTDYARYKTTYDLYAEVHRDFQWPNVRHVHPPFPRKGSFYDYVLRWGDTAPEGGWKYELDQSSLIAKVSANGTHPSSGETHSTSSEARENPNELIILCDYCDDSGCSMCHPHRE